MLSNQFQGVVINASFPRSGHRFLRELCLGYFAKEMRFFNSYSPDALRNGHLESDRESHYNYIKTHDFELQGFDVLKTHFPLRRKYIVQVRHPLESIASYYEFALKNGEVKQDTKAAWSIFLNQKLCYWKSFCETWLAEESTAVLLVTYEHLSNSTALELKKVIQFITGDQRVDEVLVTQLVEKKPFNQYAGEDDSAKSGKRKISNFKYFDKAHFRSLQDELYPAYLGPLGLKLPRF